MAPELNSLITELIALNARRNERDKKSQKEVIDRQVEVIQMLGRLGRKAAEAVPYLVQVDERFCDSDLLFYPPLSKAVEQSIAEIDITDDGVVNVLFDALQSANPVKKTGALMALEKIASSQHANKLRAHEIEQVLLYLVDDATAVVRSWAIILLSKIGLPNDRIVTELWKAVDNDNDDSVRAIAFSCLLRLLTDDEKVQALIRALSNNRRAVRDYAVQVLVEVKLPTEEVVEGLFQAMDTRVELHYRGWALRRLVSIDHRSANVRAKLVKVLHSCLSDFDETIRQMAVENIGRFGLPTDEVIQALIDVMHHDRKPWVRRAAVDALMQSWPKRDNDELLDAFIKALEDSDGEVRSYAVKVLVKMGRDDDKVIQALLKVLNDTASESDELLNSRGQNPRIQAARALKTFNRNVDQAIQALIDMVDDSNQSLQLAAVDALGAIARSTDVELITPVLTRLSNYRVEELSRAASRALYKVWVKSKESTIEILTGVIRDGEKSREERLCAAQGLVEIFSKYDNPPEPMPEGLILSAC